MSANNSKYTTSPDDYLALSRPTFFVDMDLLVPLDAEFYALSPRSFSKTASAFYLQKNASFCSGNRFRKLSGSAMHPVGYVRL